MHILVHFFVDLHMSHKVNGIYIKVKGIIIILLHACMDLAEQKNI